MMIAGSVLRPRITLTAFTREAAEGRISGESRSFATMTGAAHIQRQVCYVQRETEGQRSSASLRPSSPRFTRPSFKTPSYESAVEECIMASRRRKTALSHVLTYLVEDLGLTDQQTATRTTVCVFTNEWLFRLAKWRYSSINRSFCISSGLHYLERTPVVSSRCLQFNGAVANI